MLTRNKAVAVLVSIFSIFLIPVESNAAVSCATINNKYSYGISANKFAKNVGNSIIGKPKVSASLYKKHIALDKDKDKIVCEKERPVVASKPTPTPTQSAKPVIVGFLANINGSVPATHSVSIKHSDTVNPQFLEKIKTNIYKAIDATDEIALPKNFNVYLFTVKDAAWLQSMLSETGASMYMPAPSAAAYLANSNNEDCGQAFIATIGNQSMFFQCTAYDGSGWESSVHEYFHMIQIELNQFGSNRVPLWLFEGAPTYFQDLIHNNLDPYGRIGNPKITRQDVLTTMQILEVVNDPGGSIVQSYKGYQFGYFAVKHLVDKYGYLNFVKFNKEISTSSDWKQLFRSIYQIDINVFYNEVADNIYNLYN